MVNSVGFSNVSFQGGPKATANARPYMQAPYQHAGVVDTVEISGKKPSKAKGVLGTILGAVVLAAGLYAGVKTGKLTKIDNPTKWTEKLQNLAHTGGTYVGKGIQWITEKGKTLMNKKTAGANTSING